MVTGGRYDNLMEQFGRKAKAVGFAIVLDSVMAALSRQRIDMDIPRPQALILYVPDWMERAIELACRLRRDGDEVRLQRIENIPDDTQKEYYKSYAASQGFERLILYAGEELQEERL